MTRDAREFDVLVWGASGFTGRLVAEYLLREYGAQGELRWAIGGRSQSKLEAIRKDLGPDAATLPIVTGEATSAADMDAIASRTRVVCTTVGPYAKYGSALVEACAKSGTDYCDLTGEIQWMLRMIDTHLDAAQSSGARIVHTCGFDCIPSDLGVYFLQREMDTRYGTTSRDVKLRVDRFSGGASGGTIASMLNMLDEAAEDPSVLRAIADPYSINPKGERTGPDGGDQRGPVYDADYGKWTAPFVMAGINTKVVRRTNALLGYPYGRDFRYEEAMLTGPGPGGFVKALGVAAATGAGMAVMSVGPLRRLIAGRLPAPGEGPSKAQREAGFFDLRLHAVHPTEPGTALEARVQGDRDPGYGSTSKMLGEAAVCLALDPPTCEGGFHTPAAAMGDALLTRLAARAGVTFTIESPHT